MSLRKITMSIVTTGVLVFGGSVQASLTLTGVNCNDAGGPGGMSFVACSGSWDGNNHNQEADVKSRIFSDWGLTVGTPIDVTGGITGNSGTLNLTTNLSGLFVLALKAGDAFSLYELDGGVAGISSINYNTLGVGFYSSILNHDVLHKGQGLSHADIYAPVPEPETYAMLLLGLGLIGFRLRDKKVLHNQ